MLRDTKEKKEAQEGAAVALGKIGTAGVSALSTALRDRDKDPAVRRAIVTSLGRIGPDAKPALPTLMSELNDKEGVDKKQKTANLDSIKADVVNALGDIASAKDTNVVKALQSLADSKQNKKDKNLQTAVKDAVRKIQGGSRPSLRLRKTTTPARLYLTRGTPACFVGAYGLPGEPRGVSPRVTSVTPPGG